MKCSVQPDGLEIFLARTQSVFIWISHNGLAIILKRKRRWRQIESEKERKKECEKNCVSVFEREKE